MQNRQVAYLLFFAGLLLTIVGLVLVNGINGDIDRARAQASQVENLAARERELSESLSRSALQIQNEALQRRSYVDPHSELVVASDAFDEILQAFKNGGAAEIASGDLVQIAPLPAKVQPVVDDAIAAWDPAHRAIEATADSIELSNEQIATIATSIASQTGALAVLMNDLQIDYTSDADSRARSLSIVRLLWGALAMLGFIIILLGIFVRVLAAGRSATRFSAQLEALIAGMAGQTRALAGAKSRSDVIMGTVRQGLLLVDRDFVIAPEYSRSLETIFRTRALAERNFLDVLRFIVSERTYKTAKDYADMLFDEDKTDRTLARINPLEETEVNFADRDTGGYETRFLEIEFRRIRDDEDAIVQVFCAITDITDRVRLQREIQATEGRKERQFGMLLGIVYLPPESLDDFVVTVAENLQAMNDAMKAEEVAGLVSVASSAASQDELRKRLRIVYRCVHTIKGAAGGLKLQFFERKAHDVETRISELGRKASLGGDDFLAIVLAQSELRADLEELDELRRNLKTLRTGSALEGTAFAALSAEPNQPAQRDARILDELRTLVATIAERQNKIVAFEADDLDLRGLDAPRRRAVRNALVQLVRNAVVHGIETPDERAREGKSRRGTLLLQRIGNDPSAFGVMLHDDGRGLDMRKIRARAVAMGLFTEAEAQSVPDEVAVAALFEPGFSTAGEATVDAGRGIGLDVVKSAIMDDYGGEIFVRSEPGRYTTFSFTVPLDVHAEALA